MKRTSEHEEKRVGPAPRLNKQLRIDVYPLSGLRVYLRIKDNLFTYCQSLTNLKLFGFKLT
jgi:hypothetical protein